MDNELDKKIDVPAILFLLVQTHDWTLIGSGAIGLGILESCTPNWLISVINYLVNRQNTELNAETKNQSFNRHIFWVSGRLYSLILCEYPCIDIGTRIIYYFYHKEVISVLDLFTYKARMHIFFIYWASLITIQTFLYFKYLTDF